MNPKLLPFKGAKKDADLFYQHHRDCHLLNLQKYLYNPYFYKLSVDKNIDKNKDHRDDYKDVGHR